MSSWYGRNVVKVAGGWSANNQTIQGGVSANASGSLGLFGGSSLGTITQPTTAYYTSTIFNADGTNAANNILCYLVDLDGSKDANFPNGTLTANHPVTHPTKAGQSGWISFADITLPENHVNKYILVLPQPNTAGLESGVSIESIPQTTGDGNG